MNDVQNDSRSMFTQVISHLGKKIKKNKDGFDSIRLD